MKPKTCVAGIDFGTTSLSAVVIDICGARIEEVFSCNTDAYISMDDPSRREQSLSVLSELFFRVVARIDSLPGIRVVAYGFTGQMHGIIGLDKDGRAATNLVTWQDKSGSSVQTGGTTLLDKLNSFTGTPLADGYGMISLYKWITIEGRKDIVSFCTVADYFARMLASYAENRMDATNAHSIGMFDAVSDDWDTEAIGRAGLSGIELPRISSGPSVIGYRQTGGEAIPVVCAIGDNQASFMGSVADRRDSVLLNVGTGAQLSFVIDKGEAGDYAKYIDGYDTQLRPFDRDSFLVATSFLNGGSAYRALFDFFSETAAALFGTERVDGQSLWRKMEEAGRESMSDPMAVSPLFEGTRADRDLRGEITGISTANLTPGNLVSGFLLGLARLYKTGYFPELNDRIRYVCGSGNGLQRNALLREVVEREFGRPLVMVPYSEEAAVGAAVNAASVSGVYGGTVAGTDELLSRLTKR